MRYYLCVKEIDENNEKNDINWFITYTFSKGGIHNILSSDSRYSRKYAFTKGGIYQSSELYGDDTVIDDNNQLHNIKDLLGEYLEVFEIKISEEVKNIIANKEAKGDIISITPLRILEGNVVYNVICKHKNIDYQVYTISLYNGILMCYQRMRTKNYDYRLWYEVLLHKRNKKL